MNKVELQNLVGGQLQEKFEHAFERVIENLQDPNTSFKVKRGITIKLSFTQNENRDDVSVSAQVVEKLAPRRGVRRRVWKADPRPDEPESERFQGRKADRGCGWHCRGYRDRRDFKRKERKCC